jgi:hypothetical protein
MGFNLMAALGGAGRAMSQSIQEDRLQMDKIELMDAEAATRERLAKAAEKREQDKENERIAEGLSYYLTDEEVAVAMRRGIGSAKELLVKAQNFDGDFGAAFNLPELKTAPYGEDLLGIETEKLNAIKSAEVARLTAPLSTFITEQPKPDKESTTYAEWELDWVRAEIDIAAMPDGPEKDAALNEHDAKLAKYTATRSRIEDAKRKPEDQTTKPYYSIDQIGKLINGKVNVAYSTMTGFAGARELDQKDRSGSNTIPVADYIGAIMAFNHNEKVGQAPELTESSRAYAEAAEVGINSYANKLTNNVLNQLKANNTLDFTNRDQKPTAVLEEDQFKKMSKQNQLDFGGIYIVKTKDNKLLVATYLGFEDVFGTDKTLKYKEHYNIKIPKSVYDALEVQEFN